MKNLYRTIALAAIIMAALASCGNAGAQNDKKAEKKAKGVTELTAETFQTKVYNMNQEDLVFLGDKPAIVDFTATWCGPCQRIAPILDELATEYDGKIVIYKVDIDKNRELAKAFKVSSIPAVLYIPLDGEPVMTVGSRDKGKFTTEIETILLGK
jgi:thioredoxin